MSLPAPLMATFLEVVAEASPARGEERLEAELHSRIEAGRAAWPGVALDPALLVRYLAARSAEGLPSVALAGDLHLACACAAGIPAALESFQHFVRADVRRSIARTDASPPFLDEVMQQLNVKLFVRTGERACDHRVRGSRQPARVGRHGGEAAGAESPAGEG